MLDDQRYQEAIQYIDWCDVYLSGARVKGMPQWLSEMIRTSQYADRRGISYEQAVNEPNEAVELAFLLWQLQDENANVKRAPQTGTMSAA